MSQYGVHVVQKGQGPFGNTTWSLTIAKHFPALPPAEFTVTDFELEGLKALWGSRHTANCTEVRCQKHCRPNFSDIGGSQHPTGSPDH